MPHTRKQPRAFQSENVTGHAGWLSISLLLGLLAVALATSSLGPNFTSSEEITDYVYVQRYEQVFETVYDLNETDASVINQDVAKFLEANGLPPETVIVQAQFVGGYTENLETNVEGVSRAESFKSQIDTQDSALLLQAELSYDSTNKIYPDKVIFRVRFGDPIA